MSKIARNRFLWFIVAVVCVVIAYDYQKSKAAEKYQKMLEIAAKNCDLEIMKSLIKESRDDSSVSKKALYYASEKGCLEIVAFLLDEGVDINISLVLHPGNIKIFNFYLLLYKSNISYIGVYN